jgi:subtilisin family serine protease
VAPSEATDIAVMNSISAGIVYVVSAGNDSTLACNQSPARVAEALTVGAIDQNDRRAVFSNYGSCVDIFAPGVSITSASHLKKWRNENSKWNFDGKPSCGRSCRTFIVDKTPMQT